MASSGKSWGDHLPKRSNPGQTLRTGNFLVHSWRCCKCYSRNELETFEELYWFECEPQLCLGIGNLCTLDHDRCDKCVDYNVAGKVIAYSSGKTVPAEELVAFEQRWRAAEAETAKNDK